MTTEDYTEWSEDALDERIFELQMKFVDYYIDENPKEELVKEWQALQKAKEKYEK